MLCLVLWLFVFAIAGAPAEPVDAPPLRPASYALQWDAPPGCPTAADIRTRIEALHPNPMGGEGMATILGRVQEMSADRFSLTLETHFAERIHRRELTSEHCEALAEAVAILAATALRAGVDAAMQDPASPVADDASNGSEPLGRATSDPSRGPRARPSTETPSEPLDRATRDPGAKVAPVSEPQILPRTPPGATLGLPLQSRSQTPARRRAQNRHLAAGLEGFVRGEGLAEFGALPGVAGGVRVRVGVAGHRLSVEVGGLYLAPRTQLDERERGGRFQSGSVDMRACWNVLAHRTASPARLIVPLCGGFELGAIRADTTGLGSLRTVLRPWGGPALSLGLAYPLGPVRISIGAEMVGRMIGQRYLVDGVAVFEQLAISTRGWLGVEVRFGLRAGRRTKVDQKPSKLDTADRSGA